MNLAAALLAALACPAFADYGDGSVSPAAQEVSIDTAAAQPQAGGVGALPFVQDSDEDLAALVMDYIRRDTALKGSFLVEDKAAKKVLKLTVVSAEPAAKAAGGGEKTVEAVFRDEAGRKYTLVFRLQAGPWGGLDIYRIELKAGSAVEKRKAVKGEKV